MVSILSYSLFNMVSATTWYYEWQIVLIGIAQFVPAFELTPRFILSLQELYVWDL